MKFSGAQKLKILRCFRILHVQILSGFKNWDIQDLILRRSDTSKSCRWNFFNFSWVVFIGKYVKIRLKNRRLPYKKVEQKIEQKRLLLFTFFIFYGVSCVKTDLHNKYIFNFVFGWFLEQDHLLNLFIFRSLCEKMT